MSIQSFLRSANYNHSCIAKALTKNNRWHHCRSCLFMMNLRGRITRRCVPFYWVPIRLSDGQRKWVRERGEVPDRREYKNWCLMSCNKEWFQGKVWRNSSLRWQSLWTSRPPLFREDEGQRHNFFAQHSFGGFPVKCEGDTQGKKNNYHAESLSLIISFVFSFAKTTRQYRQRIFTCHWETRQFSPISYWNKPIPVNVSERQNNTKDTISFHFSWWKLNFEGEKIVLTIFQNSQLWNQCTR